jgi:hypothetical protein
LERSVLLVKRADQVSAKVFVVFLRDRQADQDHR